MVDLIVGLFSGMSVEWQVFLLAMIPVTELRAALPLGVALGLGVWSSFFWAVCGNVIIVFPLLLLFRWLYAHAMHWKGVSSILEALAIRACRNEDKVRRYGWWGLVLLVAVPLPGTGVWTGSLLAVLLRRTFWFSASAIVLGGVIAGLVVALITGGIVVVSQGVLGKFFLILIALLVIFWLIFKRQKIN